MRLVFLAWFPIIIAIFVNLSPVIGLRHKISDTSASNLVENFREHIFDGGKYSPISTVPHAKWEQYMKLRDGRSIQIDWIFHSSKSMQARMNSLNCDLVTWVVIIESEPIGQITCLWSMLSGNHCNQVCQFPMLPSYEYVNYTDLLTSLGLKRPMASYIVTIHSGNISSDVTYQADNSYIDNDIDIDTSTDTVQDFAYSHSESDPTNFEEDFSWKYKGTRRYLRTYSDSDKWTPLSSNKVTSFSGVANENFGSSVSISGDYMAIGAIGTKNEPGKVYVYQRLGVTIWKQEYFALVGNDDYTNEFFGWCLSLSGDTVAVGAYQTMHVREEQRTAVGGVYMYIRVSAGWILEGFLQVEHDIKENKNDKDPHQIIYDHFGWAVSLHQSTLVVGAYGDSTVGASAGAAYIFDRINHAIYGWSLSQKLLPTDGVEYASFGWSVATYENTTAVGAYGHSSNDLVFNGAVYIFQRIGVLTSSANPENSDRLQSWTQTVILIPADGGSNDYFGWDVALWRNLLAVGSHDWATQDPDDTPTGAVYTYATNEMRTNDRSITNIYMWQFDQKLIPNDATTRHFGNNIALSEKSLLVGSFGDENSVLDGGQAFIYTASKTTDSSSSDTDADDAYSDNQQTKQVVGMEEVDASDQSRSNSHQLYEWKYVATLIPNTTEVGIDFGFSVAIDQVTAVIGAVRADGRATDSGAAFVFIMSNTKFEYPLSEGTYLALVSFLPIFFLTVFCIIGTTTMACAKLKTDSTFLSFFELLDDEDGGDDGDDDYDDYSARGSYDLSSHSSMDDTVYSETELIRHSG